MPYLIFSLAFMGATIVLGCIMQVISRATRQALARDMQRAESVTPLVYLGEKAA